MAGKVWQILVLLQSKACHFTTAPVIFLQRDLNPSGVTVFPKRLKGQLVLAGDWEAAPMM